MIEVEPINSDHPLAEIVSIIETLALAVDTAREIVEKEGFIPERPADN